MSCERIRLRSGFRGLRLADHARQSASALDYRKRMPFGAGMFAALEQRS